MNPLEAEVLLAAKPIILKALESYVFPKITALESKIGNAEVQALVKEITTDVENIGVQALGG